MHSMILRSPALGGGRVISQNVRPELSVGQRIEIKLGVVSPNRRPRLPEREPNIKSHFRTILSCVLLSKPSS